MLLLLSLMFGISSSFVMIIFPSVLQIWITRLTSSKWEKSSLNVWCDDDDDDDDDDEVCVMMTMV